MATSKKNNEEVEVVLLSSHFHRGVERLKGEKLKMPRFRAERLVNPNNDGKAEKNHVRAKAKYV